MIILCRHGETEWNILKKQQGWKDSPLTKKGRNMAFILGEELRGINGLEKIYSSSLKRALNTSIIVNKILNLELKSYDLLKECSFGIFEGKTREEREQEPYAGLINEREKDLITKYFGRYPEGESYEDVDKRVKKFLDKIDLNSGNIIVAHEAINRILVKNLLNLSIEESMMLSQSNDIIYKIDSSSSSYKKIGEKEWIPGLIKREESEIKYS